MVRIPAAYGLREPVARWMPTVIGEQADQQPKSMSDTSSVSGASTTMSSKLSMDFTSFGAQCPRTGSARGR
ncbi:hypothetical protein CLV63_118121 [Murinocardiopsis flavida]|uniref:Uncharacterized protein n=1 Tax=Murinocardiopsis flavida TaxID=645275 RepID=A0A2P8D576_9ACTN|nr:hypothetical protein CLV63_118121 [Murinocardiopsis flavida]